MLHFKRQKIAKFDDKISTHFLPQSVMPLRALGEAALLPLKSGAAGERTCALPSARTQARTTKVARDMVTV